MDFNFNQLLNKLAPKGMGLQWKFGNPAGAPKTDEEEIGDEVSDEVERFRASREETTPDVTQGTADDDLSIGSSWFKQKP
jgi:hypothetical protein